MTEFKIGDEVAWIVKYIKHDTSRAAVHDGFSATLETSLGNFMLVHNPRLLSTRALDVNKQLLKAAEKAIGYCEEISTYGSKYGVLDGPIVSDARYIARGLEDAIAAAEKGA
jgi:hypothetical protein